MLAVATGLVCAAGSGELAAQGGATRQQNVPDFSLGLVGWVNLGGDFQPVPGAPEPSRNNPAHPYVSNQVARARGIQPTFRVADLTHRNIKPWAKAIIKRENDKVLAGGIGYTPRSSCMPAGVPLQHVSSGRAALLRTDAKAGRDNLCRGCAGPARLSGRSA